MSNEELARRANIPPEQVESMRESVRRRRPDREIVDIQRAKTQWPSTLSPEAIAEIEARSEQLMSENNWQAIPERLALTVTLDNGETVACLTGQAGKQVDELFKEDVAVPNDLSEFS